MLIRVLVVSTIAAATVLPMQAQQQTFPSQQTAFNKWVNEDVFWIITDQERTAFQRLQSDDERQTFINQFWLRRDPTPGSPDNEFRTEHYRRVQYANDRFSTPNSPGWKTDRGMTYIRYGAPDEKEDHPEGSPPFETWRYRYLEGVGPDVVIEFVRG